MYYIKTGDGDTYGPFESHQEASCFEDSCLNDCPCMIIFIDGRIEARNPYPEEDLSIIGEDQMQFGLEELF